MDYGFYLLGHLPHFAQSAVPLGTLVDERQKRERHTESIPATGFAVNDCQEWSTSGATGRLTGESFGITKEWAPSMWLRLALTSTLCTTDGLRFQGVAPLETLGGSNRTRMR
jgi:hypothetical protein